jgi:hypothetical protein
MVLQIKLSLPHDLCGKNVLMATFRFEKDSVVSPTKMKTTPFGEELTGVVEIV